MQTERPPKSFETLPGVTLPSGTSFKIQALRWGYGYRIKPFTVANGMEGEVRNAFVNRPHLVESAPGFVRLDVLCPAEEPKEFWLFTYWETEEHFRQWHKHHLHDSHHLIPKGLRLDPSGTRVQVLHHIAS